MIINPVENALEKMDLHRLPHTRPCPNIPERLFPRNQGNNYARFVKEIFPFFFREERRMKVLILKMGKIECEVIRAIGYGIEKAFPNTESVVGDSLILLPPEAFDKKRRQYRASNILSWITLHVTYSTDRVLGVTEEDLYADGLNFVFGEAQFSGRACIISICRLRPESYGSQTDRILLEARSVKEAIHELGHTLGLAHCRNPLCVMYFSNSIFDTDRKKPEFCGRCREKLPTNL